MTKDYFFERVLTYRTVLIRVGEFANLVRESFFDLNDGVGAEAFAFGKVGGGFDVVDTGVKDFTVEWGEFNAPCADAFKYGLEGGVFELGVNLFGDIFGVVGKVVKWDRGVMGFVAAVLAVGVVGGGCDDATQEGAEAGAVDVVALSFKGVHEAQEHVLGAVVKVVLGDAFEGQPKANDGFVEVDQLCPQDLVGGIL